MRPREPKLVIDLAAVTYIDNAAIGCLMDIHRLLESRKGAVMLSGLQPHVETVLSMTGVQKIVDVRRDEAEALAAFGHPPNRVASAGVAPRTRARGQGSSPPTIQPASP